MENKIENTASISYAIIQAGFAPRTKEFWNAYHKEWRRRNKESRRESNKDYEQHKRIRK